MQKEAIRQPARLKKILKHVDKSKPGVEIGPIHNPKAPKRDGYQVHIIDHLSRADLVQKYRHHNIDLDKIEEVDFVWAGERYAELTGHTNHYHWIIATHVVEHVPDLIGFLNNCAEILTDNGIISLSVPDKRFCFDHFRPSSGLGQIIDSHLQNRTVHSPGTIAEFLLNTVSLEARHSWYPMAPGSYAFIHTPEQAKPQIARAANGVYVDAHAWCFTPSSFRLIIHDLYQLGYISVCEYDFPEPSHTGEIYMTLRKGHPEHVPNRLSLLQEIEAENQDPNGAIIRRKNRLKRLRRKFGKRFAE
ncbi:MAG: methyltransferase domain-containing protein [Deltaproteobacteria bacterium]|nr:methyltransferase domain-containing protein [Deltaproteobacteria bacterium]